MKRRLLFGTAISISLLVLVFRQLDLSQVSDTIRSISYLPLIAAGITLSLTLVIRSWRWRYLFEPVKKARMSNLLSATSIGASMDMLLPARSGDVIRAYVIGRKEQTSKIASLSTIVVEKVLDILVLLVIAFVTIAVISFSKDRLSLPSGFSVAVFLLVGVIPIVIALLWFLMANTEKVDWIMRAILAFLPERILSRLSDTLISVAQGLQVLRQRESLVRIIILSILLWSLFALGNLLVLHSFGLHLPVYASFLILVFQILGVTLPSSPGFIGTYHAAVIAGLAVFGISQELALSVAIVMHITFFLPFIMIGLFFLWKENLSAQDIWSANAEAERA
ncbi:MAG TPA: lysylphosphatidylglycerol synthase transmembrane domain-containing protein [Desulfosporosinus sp.]|nr:lysylphosphatidylglycerol synthase transmembrane domain-containing protein [Desulfosporosinus sp.]